MVSQFDHIRGTSAFYHHFPRVVSLYFLNYMSDMLKFYLLSFEFSEKSRMMPFLCSIFSLIRASYCEKSNFIVKVNARLFFNLAIPIDGFDGWKNSIYVSTFNSNSHCRYCDWLQRQNQLLPNGTKMNWKSLVISDFVIPDLQNGQNAPKMPPKCLYDFCFMKTCKT